MKLVELTHVTDAGIYHEICFDMDVIRIHCVADAPLKKCTIIYWSLPGADEENQTRVTDSYEELKEKIWGIKE